MIFILVETLNLHFKWLPIFINKKKKRKTIKRCCWKKNNWFLTFREWHDQILSIPHAMETLLKKWKKKRKIDILRFGNDTIPDQISSIPYARDWSPIDPIWMTILMRTLSRKKKKKKWSSPYEARNAGLMCQRDETSGYVCESAGQHKL